MRLYLKSNCVFLILIFLLLSSCSTSYTLSNEFNANSVKKLNYVQPFCSIVSYNDKTKQYDLDTNSFTVAESVNDILVTCHKPYHLNDRVPIEDSVLSLNFYKDAMLTVQKPNF